MTYVGKSFYMRPLSDDSYTVCVAGEAVGRALFSFGAAQGVSESPDVTEEVLTTVADAWFAAIDEG